MREIKVIVFDWDETVVRDLPEHQGRMADRPQVEMMPGIREALDTLSERFVLCIASNADNSDAAVIRHVLEREGLGKYFRELISSRDIGAKKPDQAFFRKVVERLGVEPGECIMIGDDYKNDIAPAKAAGMHTIWITDSTRIDTAPYADGMVDSIEDLLDEVLKITG